MVGPLQDLFRTSLSTHQSSHFQALMCTRMIWGLVESAHVPASPPQVNEVQVRGPGT